MLSGKLFSSEQPEQKRLARDFNLQMSLGRLLRFLQLRKHKLSSAKGDSIVGSS